MIVRVVESKRTTVATHVVRFTGLGLGQADLRVLRIGEAADRTYLVRERHRRTVHGVGGGHEAVLYRLRNQHQAAGNVAGREDVRRRGLKVVIDPHDSREHRSRRPRSRGSDLAVSATQPTATTAERSLGAVALPSFENTIRTPLGVFSKDSMVPKFSRTSMPASRKAAATAADTSSSSVVRMRGPPRRAGPVSRRR